VAAVPIASQTRINKKEKKGKGIGTSRFSKLYKAINFYFYFNLLLQNEQILNVILFHMHFITTLFISF
jgi:hypothetical protein